MDYRATLKRIISSQYAYKGLRITAAVIIPALILYQYDLLAYMTAIPLGALVVGLTDSPGPLHHRRNTMLAAICTNFIVVVSTIFMHHNPIFIIPAIIVFGIFFSMLGVYGNRANSIGLLALLVFIFNIDSKASFGNPWLNGLLFTAGGAWYFTLSMFLHTLRPFRYIQQQLGDTLRETAAYMQKVAAMFKPGQDHPSLVDELRNQQIVIQHQHDTMREMLLDTREMVVDSTVKGRTLMMMFLDSVDLFEQLLTLQQNYQKLQETFSETEILSHISFAIEAFSNELAHIALAIQFNESLNATGDIEKILHDVPLAFASERKKKLNRSNIEAFISLRQILYSVQDVGERIKRLHRLTRYEHKTIRDYSRDEDLRGIKRSTELSPALLVQNISFASGHFRHAMRVTFAMLIGYIFSLFFTVGHGYWILLTIVTILKPAYAISRTRNTQRLFGTLTGVAVAFGFLYLVPNNTFAFLVMIVTMILSYSLLTINYYASSAFITMYVLISIHLLNQSDFTAIVKDRAIDTLIGCTIAFIVSLFVLPLWEEQQTPLMIEAALEANHSYFNVVATLFLQKVFSRDEYNAARKNAFVALANLNDNFQKMLSEPRSKQQNMEYYHQFVASSYMLTVHIATLSSLFARAPDNFRRNDFEPLAHNINEKFKRATHLVQHRVDKPIISKRAPITSKVQALLQQRQQEIESGFKEVQSDARITLRELKSITDEFQTIDSIVGDEIRILKVVIERIKR